MRRSDHFETFLATKYPTSKRFGLEGCEVRIALTMALPTMALLLTLALLTTALLTRCSSWA